MHESCICFKSFPALGNVHFLNVSNSSGNVEVSYCELGVFLITSVVKQFFICLSVIYMASFVYCVWNFADILLDCLSSKNSRI